jgi:flagellar M-ring protein FliF
MTFLGEYWATLGMIGLGLFSLVMLRSMVRSAPVPTPTPARVLPGVFPGVTTAEVPASEAARPTPAARLRRFQGSGRSLRDELSDLVKEDPNVAANILKSWISHAG